MLDIVLVDGKARGIITRDLINGKIERHAGDAVVLATGGYGNVFYLSTNAKGCNVTASYRAYKRGAAFANPCFTQIHPTCIPVAGDHQSKLTLMRFGFPRRLAIIALPRIFLKANAIIISNANILHSATSPHAIFLHAQLKRCVMKAVA